ncbi:MAG: metal ABC transporter permease [Tissierellia bacterium]|nr:metal ABC transporter permease [Tissierellia bacterium]
MISYTFLVVAIGAGLLSLSAGAVGFLAVLNRQSLIGDAIGHSSFLGIVISFMLFRTRSPIILLIGAFVSGLLAYFFIILIKNNSKLKQDAALAIVLSTFFAWGLALKSNIQGNENYNASNSSSLQSYIFGQAAFIMKSDVKVIFIMTIIILSLLFIFLKSLKISIFDPTYAKSIGINQRKIDVLMMFLIISVITIGLKLVGSILISSFLIIPAVTALVFTEKFNLGLIFSMLMALISSILGSFLSQVYDNLSTGPVIIVIMSIISFFILLISKRGLIRGDNI